MRRDKKRYCPQCHKQLAFTKRKDAIYCHRKCKQYHSRGRGFPPGLNLRASSILWHGTVNEYMDLLSEREIHRRANIGATKG